MNHEILIIDDSLNDLQLLDDILVEAGYRVRVARNGQSGFLSTQYSAPDMILIDVMLPDETGFMVCKRLKEDHSLAQIPVIFVSGIDDVDLKARAFDVGASDYITKPYNKKEILVRIHHQLERVFLAKQVEEVSRRREREHIVRELHDSVKDSLVVIGVLTESLLLNSEEFSSTITEQIQHINQITHTASAEVRTLLTELRSSYIDELPMPQLLEQLVLANRMRLGADIELNVDIGEDLPPSKKLMCYRITQEALTNIIKYAQATHVHIGLVLQKTSYHLVIEDNGKGFDMQNTPKGIGIESMRERAEQQGATIHISSTIGQGTRIELTFENKRVHS